MIQFFFCIQAEFEKGMTGIVKRAWPGLSYISCITSGTNSMYKSLLEKSFCKGNHLCTLWLICTR